MEKDVSQRLEALRYHYEKDGDSLTLRGKKERGAVVFLSIWLTIWTAGCVLLTWQVIAKPSILEICFAVPFWAGWFAGGGVLLAVSFGRSVTRLDRDGLSDEYRVWFWRMSRRVPLGEVRYFHAIKERGSEDDFFYAEAVNDGKPVRVKVTDFEEAEWLADELNRMLGELGSCRPPGGGALETVVIPWNSRSQHVEPPSDCRWTVNADVDSVTFEKRGKFSLAKFVMLTVIMLFWNGGISIFLVSLAGIGADNAPEYPSGGWWFMAVFMIPFVGIGLWLFEMWLFTPFARFHCVRWIVSRDSVVYRAAWFGIGRSWRYSLEGCREMVMEEGSRVRIADWPGDETGDRKITFVGLDGERQCEIVDVTMGEARWIVDNILLYR